MGNRCGSPNKSTTSPAPPSSTGSASKPLPASRPPPPTSCPPPPPPPPFLNYLTHKTNIPWNILHFWTSFLFLIYKPCVHSNFFLANSRNKPTLSRFCQFVKSFSLFQTPSHQNSLDSKSK